MNPTSPFSLITSSSLNPVQTETEKRLTSAFHFVCHFADRPGIEPRKPYLKGFRCQAREDEDRRRTEEYGGVMSRIRNKADGSFRASLLNL